MLVTQGEDSDANCSTSLLNDHSLQSEHVRYMQYQTYKAHFCTDWVLSARVLASHGMDKHATSIPPHAAA